MKVGIKYCVGCNPSFNRREFVERLIEEHKDNSYEPAFSGNSYDIILVICGCSSGCTKYENLNSFLKIKITAEQDYLKVSEVLSQLHQQEKINVIY